MPDHDDDRMIPSNDHDWIIRIHERLVVLQQDRTVQVQVNTEHGKRIADLEQWRSNEAGQQMVRLRQAAITSSIISSVVSSVVAGLIIFFVTHN